MAFNSYYACDKCGRVGGAWINYTVCVGTAVSIARKKGWQIGKNGWFCPNCRTVKQPSRKRSSSFGREAPSNG